MNILVIGNGFDLAHGLPTKYTDFLSWVINEYNFFLYMKKQDAEITKDVDNITLDVPNELLSKVKDMSQMEYNIQHELWEMINDNIWIEYFLQCPIYQKENWVDFESAILELIKSLDNDMHKLSGDCSIDDDIMNLSNKFLNNKFSDYMFTTHSINLLTGKSCKNITYRALRDILLDDLNKLIRAFEIYLTKYVEKIKIQKISPDIKNLDIDHVLSFNYTNTYEKRYSNSKVKEYDYIHGKANINNSVESNNMVLGMDEYLEDDRKNKDVEFIAFKKYFQRIYKGTGCKYKEWVDKIWQDYTQYLQRQAEAERREYMYIPDSTQQMMNHLVVSAIKEEEYSIHNLYIFGHSLDVTDKDILKVLILNDNVHTTIFYHNKDVMGQLIANLVKVIGQDELIRRTGGNTKTIQFVLQKPMEKIKDS